ncbi:MAG: LytTR family DNA-binding domain-containing protein [Bacteroidales bacterium]|jgi:DNA-binding LytR/AlgR family response regulator|nr:LytTR family DNA-binding domain-containing protein [Bacteroidales bacterium]
MKVLIVEDETIAYEYLSKLIRKIDAEIEIVAVTESISQTVKYLQSNPLVDLIFMDIHLSDGLAFSIFDMLTIETPIIFTTAFDEYAINAFKVNSIDYLLKPVQEENLRKAVEKFRKLSSSETKQYVIRQFESDLNENYHKRILVSYRDHLIPVAVEDIVFFYTSEQQTSIYLINGKKYSYNKTLDSIIQNLDPELFFRANKQFVIAINHVKNITAWFDRRLLITLDIETPEKIYVSKNKAAEFKECLTNGRRKN